jgi:hypothetical protein
VETDAADFSVLGEDGSSKFLRNIYLYTHTHTHTPHTHTHTQTPTQAYTPHRHTPYTRTHTHAHTHHTHTHAHTRGRARASHDIAADIGTRLRTGPSGLRIPTEQLVSLFSISSRSALGSAQPPIRCVPGFFPRCKPVAA